MLLYILATTAKDEMKMLKALLKKDKKDKKDKKRCAAMYRPEKNPGLV